MLCIKELEKLFSDGRITRRHFMARATAMGVTLAMSSALISQKAKAATPKKGGRFKVGISGASTTDSLDPATLPDLVPQTLNRQLRNTLVEINYQYEPIPRRVHHGS